MTENDVLNAQNWAMALCVVVCAISAGLTICSLYGQPEVPLPALTYCAKYQDARVSDFCHALVMKKD